MEHRESTGNAGRAAWVKKRIFEIIQIGRRTDIPSMCFDIAIILVILVNIAVTFLQTFEEMAGYAGAMGVVEFVTRRNPTRRRCCVLGSRFTGWWIC